MTRRTPEMARAISRAEGQSIRTCVVCGAPGTRLELEHFIMTRCVEHASARSVPWQPRYEALLPKQDAEEPEALPPDLPSA